MCSFKQRLLAETKSRNNLKHMFVKNTFQDHILCQLSAMNILYSSVCVSRTDFLFDSKQELIASQFTCLNRQGNTTGGSTREIDKTVEFWRQNWIISLIYVRRKAHCIYIWKILVEVWEKGMFALQTHSVTWHLWWRQGSGPKILRHTFAKNFYYKPVEI